MNQTAIPKPESGPLCAGLHLVVRKDCAHIMDGILEHRGRRDRGKVAALQGKLGRAEDSIGVRSHFALEQGFDGGRQERRRRDRSRIRHQGCIGNGRCQGDGRGKRDRRYEGRTGRECDRRGGRKIIISRRFPINRQAAGKSEQKHRQAKQTPACPNPSAAHTVKSQFTGILVGLDGSSQAKDCPNRRKENRSNDPGSNIHRANYTSHSKAC